MSEANIEIRKMQLSDLHPFAGNPRKISDEAFDGLGNSIKRFGMLIHIVWNKRTGNIVGGHQRYKQLIEMGEKEADVVVVDLNDNEEVALNITLNNRNVRGDFTKEVIDQLRTSEAQLGSAFKQIGLLDLYNHLCKRGFDKKTKLRQPPVSSGESVEDKGDDTASDKEQEDKPQAVIVCPKCFSQWKLKNNEVVYNSITKMGKPLGVKDACEKVAN